MSFYDYTFGLCIPPLGRIRSLLKSSIPSSSVNDGMELICGGGYNLEKAASAAKSAWISDPVHPSGHTYAKMALNLLEAMAPSGKVVKPEQQNARKRKRSESDSRRAEDDGGRSRARARAWADPRRGGQHQTHQQFPWVPPHQFYNMAARGRSGGHYHNMPGPSSGGSRGFTFGGGYFPRGRGGRRN
jgi:hypothetical protein